MGALDVGIDLGTTKVIIYQPGKGELLHEPAVISVDTRNGQVIAVGEEALRMLGRTPGYIRAEFPMEGGVISDPVLTETLLKECMRRACESFLVKHRVIICVPSMVTEVERRAVIEAVIHAGGRKVYLIEEPIAAALGAGVDITRPNGWMLVDVGGGMLDAAVISLSGVVVSRSARFGGDKLDGEIVKLIAAKYKLLIGKKMAQQIKHGVGNVFDPSPSRTIQVKGRNLLTAYPQQITVSESDVYEAIQPFGEMLVDMVKRVLDQTPPELVSDIYENGILMTGGGSLLKGAAELIEHETHVHTRVAENPAECVSVGTGRAFDYIDILQTGFSAESTYK